MKAKISKILVILLCLTIMPMTISADNAGGTGSGGGAGGNTSSGGDYSSNFYWQSGDDNAVRVAAYRFDLVYKPRNGNRYILKTVVAQDNSNSNPGSWCRSYGRSFLIQRVKEYTSAVNSTGESRYGAVYVDSGPLVDLARRLTNGETIDRIFNNNKIEDEKLIKEYITSSLGFNMDEDELRLEQDDNPGNYNSYGYRILIQKIQVYASGSTTACPTFYKFAATRKDVTSNSRVKQILAGNKTVHIEPYSVKNGIASDLWTTRDDIGIRNGYPYRFVGNENGPAIRAKSGYFADWNNGLGYNILWFSTAPFKDYDYTIDAACVNCNSDDSENKAYVIQDTNDWEAILSSKDSDNSNVVNYFSKGNGVYCREEYTVHFPNSRNTIYVDPGRYFTLNPSAADLSAMDSSSAIPNFKPIKVTKKRECRVNTEENGSNASTVLDTFRRNSEYDFKGKTGTVKFKYNEVYDESRYNMKEPEKLSVYDEPNNYNYSINGNSLTMEVTRYYTLPDNYYQYIRKQDGLSMKTKPSSNLNHYLNVGIPNLPVSFNNKGSSTNGEVSKAADIQFSFELPGKNNDTDQYSKLYLAYIQNNSYLATDNESGNIYNRYLTGQMEAGDQDLLNKSACAKMFGVNTSGFSTCVSQRKNNAIGEGSNSCITKNNISSSSTTSGYSCMVLTSEPDDPNDPPGTPGECKTEEDAKRLGRDWNPYSQSCCPVGTTYNPSLGKCEPDDDTNTCHIKNGKYYDFDGKEITKEEYDRICPDPGDGDTCRIENGKYYDFNGNEITKEEFDKICPGYVPPVCPEDECPYGCCPSGECAPMPDGTCPGTGGIDVIYRTIDLENPFPGQNAEQRNTGANWCSYNIKTQQIDCKYNNQTVKNYVTRERGGTTNGGKVYRENHVLYEVTLDTKTINAIRAYNNKNKYDDWDLNCLDNGKACISDFLRSQVDTTGECANASKSTFYTCDEDV